jgi:hypothetical protein
LCMQQRTHELAENQNTVHNIRNSWKSLTSIINWSHRTWGAQAQAWATTDQILPLSASSFQSSYPRRNSIFF